MKRFLCRLSGHRLSRGGYLPICYCRYVAYFARGRE